MLTWPRIPFDQLVMFPWRCFGVQSPAISPAGSQYVSSCRYARFALVQCDLYLLNNPIESFNRPLDSMISPRPMPGIQLDWSTRLYPKATPLSYLFSSSSSPLFKISLNSFRLLDSFGRCHENPLSPSLDSFAVYRRRVRYRIVRIGRSSSFQPRL